MPTFVDDHDWVKIELVTRFILSVCGLMRHTSLIFQRDLVTPYARGAPESRFLECSLQCVRFINGSVREDRVQNRTYASSITDEADVHDTSLCFSQLCA